MGMCRYTFVQTRGIYSTRVNRDVNCELWGTTVCPLRFISCNEYNWWVVVFNGGGFACRGDRRYTGNLCTFFTILL